MTAPDLSTLSFEELTLRGFAHALADWELAQEPTQYSDDPKHNYDASDGVGIYLDTFPALKGATISLTDYAVDDDPSLSDSVIGIQAQIWSADVSQLKRIAGDMFNLFHGRTAGMLGTVQLVLAKRSSGAILGLDTNGRRGRTENYYLTVHRPSLNRY